MASTSVTTIGEVLVITQVIPKDKASIPPIPPSDPKTPPPSPVKVDDMTVTFLRGQPLGLGTVQMFIGLLCVLFSLIPVYSWKLITYAPFSLGVAFLVSGSLALAAGRRTSIKLVWASLVSHVVSVLIGLAGVTYLCFLLADNNPSKVVCSPEASREIVKMSDMRNCLSSIRMLNVVLYGLLGLLLVLLVLQVCVAITICVFSSKAARLRSQYFPILTHAEDRNTLITTPEHGSDSSSSP